MAPRTRKQHVSSYLTNDRRLPNNASTPRTTQHICHDVAHDSATHDEDVTAKTHARVLGQPPPPPPPSVTEAAPRQHDSHRLRLAHDWLAYSSRSTVNRPQLFSSHPGSTIPHAKQVYLGTLTRFGTLLIVWSLPVSHIKVLPASQYIKSTC